MPEHGHDALTGPYGGLCYNRVSPSLVIVRQVRGFGCAVEVCL